MHGCLRFEWNFSFLRYRFDLSHRWFADACSATCQLGGRKFIVSCLPSQPDKIELLKRNLWWKGFGVEIGSFVVKRGLACANNHLGCLTVNFTRKFSPWSINTVLMRKKWPHSIVLLFLVFAPKLQPSNIFYWVFNILMQYIKASFYQVVMVNCILFYF